ncbi:transglycosylase family protein [Pseudonocardia sp. Ae706_Ps2]|uniref:transglycosylase family protein n=1 Tax=Pseudonocardia sp. Ae706_Ps2 TaxID=1885035 RepID=UPI00352A0DF5
MVRRSAVAVLTATALLGAGSYAAAAATALGAGPERRSTPILGLTAHGDSDPQLSEVGVRLTAAGLGPADLIDPPPAAALVDNTATAAAAGAAAGAVDQALDTVTAPPAAPQAAAPAAPPAQRSRSTAPPVKPGPTREPAPAATTAEPPAAAPTSTEPVGPRTSAPAAAPPATDVTTDAEAARAAIGMITDLLAAIAADGDRSGDATEVGATVLDALDRDRLAALGADSDDLDTLDHLRATTSVGGGRSDGTRTDPGHAGTAGQPTTADTEPTPEQPSAGAPITRTPSAQTNGPRASTSEPAPPESESTESEVSVAAGIEKLTAQARAAAEVDPVAQELLDALNRTGTGTGTDAGAGAGAKAGTDRGNGSTSGDGTAGNGTADDSTDNDTADDTDAGAGDETGGGAGEQPRTPAVGAAPPPEATDDTSTSTSTGTGIGSVSPATWDRLAQCESGGDWSTNTGNGFSGGLQFSPSTWRAFGGEGPAHEAGRDEQIEVAKRVQAVQGWEAWPACAQRLGLR